MSPNPSLTTSAAFDLLQDEIDARLAGLQAEIADTAKRGAYEKVGQLAKAAQELADLKKELVGVEKRYNRLIETDEPDESYRGRQAHPPRAEDAARSLPDTDPPSPGRPRWPQRAASSARARPRDDESPAQRARSGRPAFRWRYPSLAQHGAMGAE